MLRLQDSGVRSSSSHRTPLATVDRTNVEIDHAGRNPWFEEAMKGCRDPSKGLRYKVIDIIKTPIDQGNP